MLKQSENYIKMFSSQSTTFSKYQIKLPFYKKKDLTQFVLNLCLSHNSFTYFDTITSPSHRFYTSLINYFNS